MEKPVYHMQPLYIFTDMDRTIIANGMQPESEQAAALFAALCNHPQVCVTYVSGRHLQLVLDAVDFYRLPIPDYVITDVGTRIYHRMGESWQWQKSWDDRLKMDWSYDRMFEAAGVFAKRAGWSLQEIEKQSDVKISFYVPLQTGEERIQELEQYLRGMKYNMVWSIDEKEKVGLLDLLPPAADKLQAIRFLGENVEHIDMNLSVFSGDSGNDAAVLTSEIRGILVANASEEFKRQMQKLAREKQLDDRLYVAQGGFLSMNGCYRGGVLEGIAHYFPQWEKIFKQWMQEK